MAFVEQVIRSVLLKEEGTYTLETPPVDLGPVNSVLGGVVTNEKHTVCVEMPSSITSMRLIEHGRSPATPVALISWGTYPRQKTLTGTEEGGDK